MRGRRVCRPLAPLAIRACMASRHGKPETRRRTSQFRRDAEWMVTFRRKMALVCGCQRQPIDRPGPATGAVVHFVRTVRATRAAKRRARQPREGRAELVGGTRLRGHHFDRRRLGSHAETLTHPTVEPARKAIDEAVGDGVTIGQRPRDPYDFRPCIHIPAGTAVADFPWNNT